MAYTSSFLTKTTFGNQKVMHIRVTADAASGSVITGLKIVEFFHHSAQSCTTTGFRTFLNTSDAMAALNGSVAISGSATGNTSMLTVYGH